MKLRATLDFLLNDWLHTTELTQRPRFTDHSRETFDAVLDTCERIARKDHPEAVRIDASRRELKVAETFDERTEVDPGVRTDLMAV